MDHYNKKYTWLTHVLLTPNGIAYKMPNVKKKKEFHNKYHSWYHAEIFQKKYLIVTPEYPCAMLEMVKLGDKETQELYEIRISKFFEKFKPYQMNKAKEYLEQLRNDPNTKKKELKRYEEKVTIMISNEEERMAIEQKRKMKEEKKRMKKELKEQKKNK